LAWRLHLKANSDIDPMQLNLRRIAMFTSQNFLHASERAVCLFASLLIVSSVLALGAFGIDSMVSNAQNTQTATLLAQTAAFSVPA
jgi:hypothetical protein